MSSKVLVTGAAGFIGSHLTEFLLAQGLEVLGVDNFDPFYPRAVKEANMGAFRNDPNFEFFELDLLDAQALQGLPPFDTVVHLAAKAGVRPSIQDPQGYIDVNITATHRLLQLCVKRSVKKIAFASSSSIYGNSKHIPFIEEGHEYEPISPYAFTKRSCELMNYTYHHLYKLDIVNMRFFTVYGPRQRPDLAIHKFVKKLSMGESIEMYGDGSTSRDYTFVSDTVAGIYGVLTYLWRNEGVYQIVNLGNNKPVRLSHLIEIIGNALETVPIINCLPMQEGDVDITFADIEKAKRMLGYNPDVSIEEGVQRFVKWYRTPSLASRE